MNYYLHSNDLLIIEFTHFIEYEKNCTKIMMLLLLSVICYYGIKCWKSNKSSYF